MLKRKVFALVDCNNFYVSCERVFNPQCHNKPTVVLSNNDGCIISRSNEVKNLGIPMGAPLFKMKGMVKKHQIHVFSANFCLYGDMSRRVMDVLKESQPNVEIYSIDEAFIEFDEDHEETLLKLCHKLRYDLLKKIGIPVSIGIGSSKTLAKLANKKAKKQQSGVYSFLSVSSKDELKKMEVSEIWGIGRRHTKRLKRYNVLNVGQFMQLPKAFVKKVFTVMGERTWFELHGHSCIPLELIAPDQKAIVRSRSFGKNITAFSDLEEAVSCFVTRACEKIRELNLLTSQMSVFLETNSFLDEHQFYSNSSAKKISSPTDQTPKLIQEAVKLLKRIYKKDRFYKKAGIMFTDLVPRSLSTQTYLFSEFKSSDQWRIVLDQVDRINQIKGKEMIRFGIQCGPYNWRMRQNHLSKRFTTRWSDLPVVYAC